MPPCSKSVPPIERFVAPVALDSGEETYRVSFAQHQQSRYQGRPIKILLEHYTVYSACIGAIFHPLSESPLFSHACQWLPTIPNLILFCGLFYIYYHTFLYYTRNLNMPMKIQTNKGNVFSSRELGQVGCCIFQEIGIWHLAFGMWKLAFLGVLRLRLLTNKSKFHLD
jgi:hypothetical protein